MSFRLAIYGLSMLFVLFEHRKSPTYIHNSIVYAVLFAFFLLTNGFYFFWQSDGTSETEEELILNPTSRHLSHSLYAREHHCVCECPRRPENNGRVTLRSRSLSPSRRPKSATPSVRPPFKAGKADERIISRRDFLKPGGSRQRSRTAYVEGNPGKKLI